MAEYKYHALTGKGEEVKGSVDAGSRMEAFHKLRDLGLFPTKLMPGPGAVQEEVGDVEQEALVDRYMEALPKSPNPIVMLKNYLRRKVMLGVIKKRND